MHRTDENERRPTTTPFIQSETYDDEITEADIEALRNHVKKYFGEIEDFEIVSGPAW